MEQSEDVKTLIMVSLMATLWVVCMLYGGGAGRDLPKRALSLMPTGADWWPSSRSDSKERRPPGQLLSLYPSYPTKNKYHHLVNARSESGASFF